MTSTAGGAHRCPSDEMINFEMQQLKDWFATHSHTVLVKTYQLVEKRLGVQLLEVKE